jgi:hypothetical protein
MKKVNNLYKTKLNILYRKIKVCNKMRWKKKLLRLNKKTKNILDLGTKLK